MGRLHRTGTLDKREPVFGSDHLRQRVRPGRGRGGCFRARGCGGASYRRSSSSGILHVAMNWGLPIVVTRVGGLPEAADGYDGAIFVEPGDPATLRSGIMAAVRVAGQRFADPGDWGETVKAIRAASGI